MAIYKSPGVFTRDVDYWIPIKQYSVFNRKLKINKIFNLDLKLYNYKRRTFKIPVGLSNKSKITDIIKDFKSKFKI